MSGERFDKLQRGALSDRFASGVAALHKRCDGISATVATIERDLRQLAPKLDRLQRQFAEEAAWRDHVAKHRGSFQGRLN